tara:strand:- start:2631 stop:3602 length:972 start_codon:yes stop_codon:yes gene_type:complete
MDAQPQVMVYDATHFNLFKTVKHVLPFQDECRALLCGEDLIWVMDLNNGKCLMSRQLDSQLLCWCNDGSTDFLCVLQDAIYKICAEDFKTSSRVCYVSAAVRAMTTLKSGAILVVSFKGHTRAYNVDTGATMMEFSKMSYTIKPFPDDIHFVGVGNHHELMLWNVDQAEPVHEFEPYSNPTCVTDIAIFSKGMNCATAGDEDEPIKIFDMETGMCLATFYDADMGYHHSLAVTDDDSHILCSSQQKISLYCVKTEAKVHEFYRHSPRISGIAILHGQQAFMSWGNKDYKEAPKPFLSVWSLTHFLGEVEDASDTAVVCKGKLN